jgi:hypothetical protein
MLIPRLAMQTARSDLDGIRLISPADGLSCEQAVLFHRLLDQRLCGGSGTECPEACKCMDGITRNSPEGVGFRTLVKGRGFKADMVERAVYEMWRSVLCHVGVLCKIQYLLSNFSCDSCLTYKIYSIGYIIYLMRYFALYIPLGNLETPCSSCWHTLRSFLAQSMVRNQD